MLCIINYVSHVETPKRNTVIAAVKQECDGARDHGTVGRRGW